MSGPEFHAEIIDRQPEPTAAVRIQQPMNELDLGAAFGRYLPLVESTVRDGGGTVNGPAYGRYHRYGPEVVDVEIGFPIGTPPSGSQSLASCAPGEVGMSELPGGLVATTVYIGSYDGLAGVYDKLHEWIHAQPGVDDSVGAWESYLEMPGVGTDGQPRTEIVWPLIRD